MNKKILSFLLTFAMIFSMAAMFAGTVSAADATPTPTLTINTYADLEAFIAGLETDDYADDYVVLGADIIVNEGWNAKAEEVTVPTDTLTHPETCLAFAGTFDGQGYTISGLYMEAGAFLPTVGAATICNVTFDNCYSGVPSKYTFDCRAIVAGCHEAGVLTYSDVIVKNSKVVNGTTNANVGTLLGKSNTASGATACKLYMTDCQSISCELYSGSNTSLVGGIVGYSQIYSELTNCYSSTLISVSGSNPASEAYKCGGMIGQVKGTAKITNCVNEGEVTSFTWAGGAVGDVNGGKAIVNGFVNRGVVTVSATTAVGGAAGVFGRMNAAYGSSVTGGENYGTIAGTANEGVGVYVGGIAGYCLSKTNSNQVQPFVEQSANYGEISSSMYAGGVLGYLSYGELTVTGFINGGKVTAVTSAGGVLGYGDKYKDDTHKTAVIVKDSVNKGEISATTSADTGAAGGVLGYLATGGSNSTVTVENFVNTGDVNAQRDAGGLFGRMSYNLNVTNYVNTGDITGRSKAGGVAGRYEGTAGTLEKVITVGLITGYNTTEGRALRSSGALFGKWEQKNSGEQLSVIDVFYSNGGSDYIWGMEQLVAKCNSDSRANYYAKYTATNAEKTFAATTDAVLAENATDSREAAIALYSAFFIENGYRGEASDLYAEKGANTFKAFNLGVDWMMTDTVPVPASVFALMDEKDIVEGEVDYVGYQANAGTALSSIRVITGLDSTEYANTGFELYLVKAGEEALYSDKNTTTVYTSLNVYDENGNAQDPYLAETAGYAFLSAITVTGLDSLTGTTTLIVKPYVTVNGVKRYGSACAVILEKTTDGVVIADQYVM